MNRLAPAFLLFLFGCSSPEAIVRADSAETPDTTSPATPDPEPIGGFGGLSGPPSSTDATCSEGMVLVEGNYCITAEERCIAHQNIYSGERGVVPNQCTRFAEPVKCFDNRRKHLRYCMDRYEWPNQKGEKPRTLTSWQTARDLCASTGKRLCTEEEFNFACEGEDMHPYVYGFSRDSTKCNFDKPYRARTFTFTEWTTCLADEACATAFSAIDQREASGSNEACRSEQGIYDLNGNVNEWVVVPANKPPHRSGLKGGWWGPVRDRCRPTVTFHDEGDFGYEVGFRCCADADD